MISDYAIEKVAEWEKNDLNFNISKIVIPKSFKYRKRKIYCSNELQSTLFVAANEKKIMLIIVIQYLSREPLLIQGLTVL